MTHHDTQMTRRRLMALAGIGPFLVALGACRATPELAPALPAGAARDLNTFIFFYTDN